MIFGLSILMTTFAASSSYAILMSVLKKEVSKQWVLWESVVTAFASFAVVGLSFRQFLVGDDLLEKVPTILMLVALVISLMLVIKVRLVEEQTVPAERVSILRSRASALFTFIIVSWLGTVALLAY